ncbi:restriction endonuclease [Halonatronum saccharophilum]|uniref:restriction endonuclease n=1 Tax=Halonatronum saccharophilum TaxID=150060 RepID=UPI0004BC3576|nr:restriction endonuclease [Halonatronum saccharophilum]
MKYFKLIILFIFLGGAIRFYRDWPIFMLAFSPILALIILTLQNSFIEEKRSVKDEVSIFDIDKMEGLEFEEFLFTFFNKKGVKTEITQGSRDQGGDLIIRKKKSDLFNLSKRIVVQVKRYSGKVGNSAVQEVVAAKAYYNCSHAMIITNSTFTASAKELAHCNSVELWNREKMIEELEETPISKKEISI